MKKFKTINLNILKFGYLPWVSLSNIIYNLGQFFRNIKWAYQRITRGFCEPDTWDLEIYYTQMLASTLSWFAKHTFAFPGVAPFDTSERWKAYLEEIVCHINNSAVDAPDEYTARSEELYKAFKEAKTTKEQDLYYAEWLEANKQAFLYREKERKKAFKMLDKCWNNLWD